MTVSPPPSLAADRATLLAYFEESYRLCDWLFSAVAEGALYQQPDPLRHPLIFYLGHPAAFYVNKLRLAGLLAAPVDAELEVLFAKGVDPHAPDELDRRASWPALDVVRGYRARVFDAVRRVIADAPLPPVVTWEHPLWALHMGCEHDRIHFETSSVLIRQLPVAQVHRPAGWTDASAGGEAPPLTWRAVPARAVQLGRPPVSDTYGWGNEYGTLDAEVPPFLATTTLVSNAAYRAFVADGGYQRPALWTPAGWASLAGAQHPRFWVPDGAGGFAYRAQFDVRPLPAAWPAEVSGHEAAAYARWAGARLPTEREWAALALDAPLVDGDVFGVPGYTLNLRYGSSTPVDHGVATPLGFHDVHGNVWQWLADDFRPLPGYRPHPLYPDFSDPYFDDQHATLRGGSWATTGTGASRYYRLWFRRHFYQHAGFRLARDA